MNENTRSHGPEAARPCLWMSAGLVSYKLCDRDFECERCPFDAAIRGEPRHASCGIEPIELAGSRVAALCFPEDRLYADGHTWVQEEAGGGIRVGLDAFAVALLGIVRRVLPGSSGAPSTDRENGTILCELHLDVGRLPVRAPVAATPRTWNRELEDDGAPLMRSPYGDGWIAELDPTGAGVLAELLSAETALERSRLDLRRFRRRAALYLFQDSDEIGPTLADGGELLTDLRVILGAHRYLELVGDLVR